MSIQHRRIPVLPQRPRSHPIDSQISRSYPVGRQSFSRACQGETLTLNITTQDPLPDNVQASLVTTLNSNDGNTRNTVPFARDDERTLVCRITPKRPGLHSFRAEFSLDRGNFMSIQHCRISVLSERPRVHPIAGQIRRSYPEPSTHGISCPYVLFKL